MNGDRFIRGVRWGATAGLTAGILASITTTLALVIYAIAFQNGGVETNLGGSPGLILVAGVVVGVFTSVVVGAPMGGLAGALLYSVDKAHKAPLVGSTLTAASVAGFCALLAVTKSWSRWSIVQREDRAWLFVIIIVAAALVGLIAGRLFASEVSNE